MKSDLDRLMEARQLAGLVIECSEAFSAERDYLTGGVQITGGKIVKKRGAAPILIVNPMETEEAKKSGLRVIPYTELGWQDLIKAAEGQWINAEVPFWERCLMAAGIEAGKIGIYGVGSLNEILAVTARISTEYPRYTFAGEAGMTLFEEAYQTKDGEEFTRMKAVGVLTAEVLSETWNFIASHRAQGDLVVKANGSPLTIGEVKRFVRRALLDRELEESGMIFAQGRDGGFPHSRGEAKDALRLGQAIVFDLFPREMGGGYFHDCTRTWSIGYATDDVQRAYDEVMTAFDIGVEVIRPGMATKDAQETVQTYLERKGHPTSRSHPGTDVGYVHSLGHGVGMNIHERPSLSHLSSDTFAVGSVFSIEPGVYYPERGYGIRVEDSFYLSADDGLISLTPFHKELVLPLRG
jgi:Xaa-Pro aminopeptidase